MSVTQETSTLLVMMAVLVLAALVEVSRERRGEVQFSRVMAIIIATLTLGMSLFQSLDFRVEPGGLAMGPMVSEQHAAYVYRLTFEGKYLCSIVSSILFFGAVLFTPLAPLVRVRMSRVYFMQALVLALIEVQKAQTFLLVGALLILMFIGAVRHHARSLVDDERGEIRARAFIRYQWLALCAIGVSLGLRFSAKLGMLPPNAFLQDVDLTMLCLASAVVVGLFPFHGWVVPFLGAPRSTVFLPLLCIETGMLFFFRLYAPIVSEFMSDSMALIILPVIGLVYASLLFFSEQRLKRIPGYLYLSHVSLMALSASGFESTGMTIAMLDGVNVVIAVLGLLGVCSLLTSRFGVRGVLAPSGLGSLFPELAVCYLVCVLSLVGFPGTLGFIEEEITLGQGLEHHAFLVGIVALALTLNGFSGFRLFARIFYGQPFEGRDPETALSLRERGVIFLILALIVLNGIAPAFLMRTLVDFAS
jgi:formate hydrogenlyase subunit 3/multisubunit Na+/H+ antiporter MnhD subunit